MDMWILYGSWGIELSLITVHLFGFSDISSSLSMIEVTNNYGYLLTFIVSILFIIFCDHQYYLYRKSERHD